MHIATHTTRSPTNICMLCLVGEEHATEQEHGNPEDQFAVAIVKSGTGVVGHIPREISKTCWMFLARDGTEIKCTVTGMKQRSVLLEGGLEIPCIYTFKGKKKLIDKLKRIMEETSITVID